MERTDAEKKLRSLGLRVGLDIATTAVQRLRNGGSLYSLYAEKPPLLAKATARKIRDLLNSGQLNFLQELEELLLPVAQQIHIAQTLTHEEHPPPFGISYESGIAPRRSESLRARLEEILPGLPRVRWSINYLEAAGIPVDVGLQLLTEYDHLENQLLYERDFSYKTVHRLVALHYIVSFYFQAHMPPHRLVELAADTFARGLIDSNRFLQQAGQGIVRYRVWAGQKFLDAFLVAQHPTLRERGRVDILRREIQRVTDEDMRPEEAVEQIKKKWDELWGTKEEYNGETPG